MRAGGVQVGGGACGVDVGHTPSGGFEIENHAVLRMLPRLPVAAVDPNAEPEGVVSPSFPVVVIVFAGTRSRRDRPSGP